MKRKPYKPYRAKRRGWLIALFSLALVLVLTIAALGTAVVLGGRTQMDGTEQVMLVLGTQVKQDGPCQSLRDRLDAALLHLKTQPDMQIIVAGGQGDDEPTTEAAAMSEYLVARGVAETQIWQEDKSRNTWQNLQNTKKLLAGKGLDPENTHLLMVSNNFHIFRAKMLAVRSGLTVSTLAAPTTHEPSRIKGYLREVPALVKAWVIDR